MRTFGQSVGKRPDSDTQSEFLSVVEKFSQVGYWHIDLRTEVVFFSDEVCSAHGMPPGYRPESIDECVGWYHPDDQEVVRDTVISAASRGEPFSYEARLKAVSKKTTWVEVNGEVRRNEDGHPSAIVGTLKDISVERELNFRLYEALREAKTASRLKDMFLANMSHELRTPLNAIIGFSQVIKMMQNQGKVDEQVGGYAGDIEGAGVHLLSLIEDIFSLAHLEAENEACDVQPIEIESLLDDLRSMTGAAARDCNCDIIFDGDAAVSSWLMADKVKITKILIFLVSNALKSSPPGESVRVVARTETCGRVFLKVIDKGPGIPEDLHEKMFERFERMEPSESSVEGVGVGLAIARDIVASMGGEIGVDSVEGEGATFWMAFPAEEKAPRAIAV